MKRDVYLQYRQAAAVKAIQNGAKVSVSIVMCFGRLRLDLSCHERIGEYAGWIYRSGTWPTPEDPNEIMTVAGPRLAKLGITNSLSVPLHKEDKGSEYLGDIEYAGAIAASRAAARVKRPRS